MSKIRRDPNKTRISPMSRFGAVIQRGNTARNRYPTLTQCAATWPVSPYRPNLATLLEPGAGRLNFPDAIWFCCTDQDVLDPSRQRITIKNPSPEAIQEIYKHWLAVMARAAAKVQGDHPSFLPFLQTHIAVVLADPSLMPASLLSSLDVFVPPWQAEPVWKSHRLR